MRPGERGGVGRAQKCKNEALHGQNKACTISHGKHLQTQSKAQARRRFPHRLRASVDSEAQAHRRLDTIEPESKCSEVFGDTSHFDHRGAQKVTRHDRFPYVNFLHAISIARR